MRERVNQLVRLFLALPNGEILKKEISRENQFSYVFHPYLKNLRNGIF